MCKSITRFPAQWEGELFRLLGWPVIKDIALEHWCPSWYIIIHGNIASHSSNSDIMKLVKTSPLSQQDRRQDGMTGPKADAFWFLTAPDWRGMGSARQQV